MAHRLCRQRGQVHRVHLVAVDDEGQPTGGGGEEVNQGRILGGPGDFLEGGRQEEILVAGDLADLGDDSLQVGVHLAQRLGNAGRIGSERCPGFSRRWARPALELGDKGFPLFAEGAVARQQALVTQVG